MRDFMKEQGLYVKAGAWYLLGNAVIKGILYYFVFVFTRLMSAGEYGLYSTYLVYENLLTSVMGLGLAQTVKPAWLAFQDRLSSYMKTAALCTLASGGIFFLFFWVFRAQIQSSVKMDLVVCLFIWGNALCNCFYFLMSQKSVAENKYRKYIFIEFFRSVPQLFLAYYLIKFSGTIGGFEARLAGHTLPLMLIGAVCLVAFLRKGTVGKEYVTYGISMGLPLIIVGLSQTILSQSDQLVIRAFWGDEGTGFYAAIGYVGSILYVIMLSIQNVWDPWFYRAISGMKKEDGGQEARPVSSENREAGYREMDASALARKVRMVGFVFAVPVCLMMLAGPKLASIFLAPEYHQAIRLIYPLSVGWMFQFLGALIMNMEYAQKKTGYASVGIILGACINLGLNYALVPVYGYEAAAWTTLIAHAAIFFWHLAVDRLVIKSGMFSLKSMGLILLPVCLLLFILL